MSYTKNVLMREAERRGHGYRGQHVCGACLFDEGLAEFVADHASHTVCDFCERQEDEDFSASLGDVIEHMEECIYQEYTDAAGELPFESRGGGFLGAESWDGADLLDHLGFHVESDDLQASVASAFSDQEWCRVRPFRLPGRERLLHGWEAFKRAVKHQRRYTFWSMERENEADYDSMPVGGMLALIGKYVRDAHLVKSLPMAKRVWRARVHAASISISQARDLSPPPEELARQPNRMSPAGVVMFYGAEDFDTACAESVVPERAAGKCVTGAVFTTTKEMQILDLVDLPGFPSFFKLGTSEYRHILHFLHRFAQDVAGKVPRDGTEHLDYVPTQAFTEYVRYELALAGGKSIDGIRYKSSANGHPCYVLFCGQAECLSSPATASRQQWMAFDASSLRTEDVTPQRKVEYGTCGGQFDGRHER